MKLVFKILSGAAGFPAVNYNENKQGKERGFLTYIQNFHSLQMKPIEEIDQSELREYLQRYSERNTRIQNPQFHAVLSCQGKSYTFEELTSAARELMSQLGYADNPLLIYGHNDTPNHHVHIVTSRVGADGKKINHTYERIRAMKILNRILNQDVSQKLNKEIFDMHKWSCKTKAAYMLVLEKLGYHMQENGKGGYSISKYGNVIGEVSEEEIGKVIQKADNVTGRAQAIGRIREKIEKAKSLDASCFNLYSDPHTKSYTCKLAGMLQQQGIHLVFFSKGEKLPYGFSIIDFKSKTVLKGSEVIALKAFLNPGQNPEIKKPLNPLEVLTRESGRSLTDRFSDSAFEHRAMNEHLLSDSKETITDSFFETAIESITSDALYGNETIKLTKRPGKKKYKGQKL